MRSSFHVLLELEARVAYDQVELCEAGFEEDF